MSAFRPMDREGLPPYAINVIVGEPDPDRRERLRFAYANIPIPDTLKHPLAGTPEERAALKGYEADLAEVVESEDLDFLECLPEWDVTLRATCTMVVTVHAASKDHAERIAEADNFDLHGEWEADDYSIDIRRIERVAD